MGSQSQSQDDKPLSKFANDDLFKRGNAGRQLVHNQLRAVDMSSLKRAMFNGSEFFLFRPKPEVKHLWGQAANKKLDAGGYDELRCVCPAAVAYFRKHGKVTDDMAGFIQRKSAPMHAIANDMYREYAQLRKKQKVADSAAQVVEDDSSEDLDDEEDEAPAKKRAGKKRPAEDVEDIEEEEEDEEDGDEEMADVDVDGDEEMLDDDKEDEEDRKALLEMGGDPQTSKKPSADNSYPTNKPYAPPSKTVGGAATGKMTPKTTPKSSPRKQRKETPKKKETPKIKTTPKTKNKTPKKTKLFDDGVNKKPSAASKAPLPVAPKNTQVVPPAQNPGPAQKTQAAQAPVAAQPPAKKQKTEQGPKPLSFVQIRVQLLRKEMQTGPRDKVDVNVELFPIGRDRMPIKVTVGAIDAEQMQAVLACKDRDMVLRFLHDRAEIDPSMIFALPDGNGKLWVPDVKVSGQNRESMFAPPIDIARLTFWACIQETEAHFLLTSLYRMASFPTPGLVMLTGEGPELALTMLRHAMYPMEQMRKYSGMFNPSPVAPLVDEIDKTIDIKLFEQFCMQFIFVEPYKSGSSLSRAVQLYLRLKAFELPKNSQMMLHDMCKTAVEFIKASLKGVAGDVGSFLVAQMTFLDSTKERTEIIKAFDEIGKAKMMAELAGDAPFDLLQLILYKARRAPRGGLSEELRALVDKYQPVSKDESAANPKDKTGSLEDVWDNLQRKARKSLSETDIKMAKMIEPIPELENDFFLEMSKLGTELAKDKTVAPCKIVEKYKSNMPLLFALVRFLSASPVEIDSRATP